jgi:hypothetical protein
MHMPPNAKCALNYLIPFYYTWRNELLIILLSYTRSCVAHTQILKLE